MESERPGGHSSQGLRPGTSFWAEPCWGRGLLGGGASFLHRTARPLPSRQPSDVAMAASDSAGVAPSQPPGSPTPDPRACGVEVPAV